MNKSKWYNLTDDPSWDEYYKFAWIIAAITIGPFFILAIYGFIIAAIGALK